MVESLTVTKQGKQLTLFDHKAKHSGIIPLFSFITLMVLSWFNSLRIWAGVHHHSGPLNVLWQISAFRIDAIVNAVLYGIAVCGWAWFYK